MDKKSIFTYLAKNPTVLLTLVIVALLPVVIVGAGIFSATTAVTRSISNRTTNADLCTQNIQVAGGVDTSYTDSTITQAQVLGPCPATTGTEFDNSKWMELIDRASDDYDSKKKYDETELDALQALAEAAMTSNMTGNDQAAELKAQVQKVFDDFKKKYDDREIYKQIADWAQSQIQNVTFSGPVAQKAVQYALSRVGESYVSVRGLGVWNKAKDAYCAVSPTVMGGAATTYQCGFDCSSLVGWAYAKATGWDTQKYGLYRPNGAALDPWGNGAAREHQYLATEGHGSKISANQLAPGDLVFLDYGGGLDNAGHVAMYVGKFGGVDRWVEAANDTANIRILNSNTPWFNGFPHDYVRPYPSTVDNTTPVGKGSTGEYKAYAKSYMGSIGLNPNDFNMLDQLFTRESGWNPQAKNPSSGAYGIPQSLPASKLASECPAGSPNCYLTDWKAQIRWGIKYIKNKYGTVKSAYDLEFCNRTINYTPKCGWY